MIDLNDYLAQAYRRDVMGESVMVEMPQVDLKEVEAQIARIDALRLGAHLASRDFVSYQNRRALIALRDRFKKEEDNGPS
jgi:hypothetical protein